MTGKYPHLVAELPSSKKDTILQSKSVGLFSGSEIVIKFNDVPVGATVEKCFDIKNVAPVSQ